MTMCISVQGSISSTNDDIFHVGVDTEPDPNDPKFPINPFIGDPDPYSRNVRQTDNGFYPDSKSQVKTYILILL